MSSELSMKQCVPCMGGVSPLNAEEIQPLHAQIEGWLVVDNHHLKKEYSFPDFVQALAFVNRLGELAEAQAHHPDLSLAWGRVGVEIWTHKIDGLSESDFVLAAKIDELPR